MADELYLNSSASRFIYFCTFFFVWFNQKIICGWQLTIYLSYHIPYFLSWSIFIQLENIVSLLLLFMTQHAFAQACLYYCRLWYLIKLKFSQLIFPIFYSFFRFGCKPSFMLCLYLTRCFGYHLFCLLMCWWKLIFVH